MVIPFFGKKKPVDPKAEAARQKFQDYEKLGKQVAALYDAINPDRKGLYRTAFLKGVVTGLGGVIGATVVVALIAWLLALAGTFEAIKPLTNNFKESIQRER